jgi:hypothetical protein
MASSSLLSVRSGRATEPPGVPTPARVRVQHEECAVQNRIRNGILLKKYDSPRHGSRSEGKKTSELCVRRGASDHSHKRPCVRCENNACAVSGFLHLLSILLCLRGVCEMCFCTFHDSSLSLPAWHDGDPRRHVTGVGQCSPLSTPEDTLLLAPLTLAKDGLRLDPPRGVVEPTSAMAQNRKAWERQRDDDLCSTETNVDLSLFKIWMSPPDPHAPLVKSVWPALGLAVLVLFL